MCSGARSTARAETVGSLLRPAELLDAARRGRDGAISDEQLREVQDRAVLDAIALQRDVGVDVMTDGEMRREAWAMSSLVLDCLQAIPGSRSYPAALSQVIDRTQRFPTVTRKLVPPKGRDLDEGFGFLRANATGRIKYTFPAPSYHRRFWSDSRSTGAYDTCEEFLGDVRDWIRGVARRVVEGGCGYIQLDAPNYGSLCDQEIREYHRSQGHDLAAQLAFDAELDSSVFHGMPPEVTRAIHLCRGNLPGGRWYSSGGYGAIADELFPRLGVDVVLLEFDSDRAGDFAPLATLDSGKVCVLGLVTTKNDVVEDLREILARIESAAAVKPLDELAVSTQCGFASVAGGNPATVAAQRAKLEAVVSLARQVWT
jgi:5-methyltetrahydropteroyltriglutamate--homocysteine methyltransferase